MILLAVSCEKGWFEEKPYRTQVVPAELSDFELLLDNNELNSGSPALSTVASDEVEISEIDWARSLFDVDRNGYTWTNDLPYLSVLDWNSTYSRIFYSNVVLDGLSKVNPLNFSEEQMFKSVRGNALFHRSKNLFEIATLYAVAYNETSASSEIGIPLKLNSDITRTAFRSNLKETYNQIVNDLLIAKDLLPVIPANKTRGSKSGASALLARVYLTMADFQKAYDFADSALKYNSALLNFNTRAQNLTNSFPAFPAPNEEIIFYSRMHSNTDLARSGRYGKIPREIYDEYADNDLRKKLFFTTLADGTIRFKGNYTGTIIPFSGLATDEMYLIRAECAARLGYVPQALQDLNTLLRTRWVTGEYMDVMELNQEDAINLILRERRKELLWRGLRWSDLRRYNFEDSRKVTLTRTIGGQTYTLEPNGYKYTFPVPDDVLSLAPQITQAPGWER